MRNLFFIFSVFLFAVSILVHGSTYLYPNLDLKWSFILHILIFVVFIPGILYANNDRRKTIKDEYNKKSQTSFTEGRPLFLVTLLPIAIIYTFVNFLIFISSNNGNVVRGFSGHWMLFFLASAFMLYKPKTNKMEVENENIAEHPSMKKDEDFELRKGNSQKELIVQKKDLPISERIQTNASILIVFIPLFIVALVIGFLGEYFAFVFAGMILFIFLISFIRILMGEKYYLKYLQINSNEVYLRFYKFKTLVSKKVPMKTFSCKYYIHIGKHGDLAEIMFYNNNELILKMEENIYHWERKELEYIAKFLDQNFPNKIIKNF